MTKAEIDKLPDPDLFQDAALLATVGVWSPRDLDDTDALLLALIGKLRNTRRRVE